MKSPNTNPRFNLASPRLKLTFSSIALAVLLVVLAACDSDSGDAEGAGTTPTEVVAEVMEPTAVPATEPPPTEPAAEATTAPEPTATAEPEPTEPEPSMPEGIALGNCANPYFPVVEGRVLHYQSTGPGIGTTTYSLTFSEVSDSSFTTISTFEDGEILTQTWICTADGLVSPRLMQLPGMEEEEGLGFEIEYDEVSGVSIAPPDQMRPGGSWTSHFVTRLTMDTDEGSMLMTQTMDLEHRVTAVESITVPAGTFDNAVRVETTSNIDSMIIVEDQEFPGLSMTIDFVSWYVEGVGLVRDETLELFDEGDEGAFVTELVAIE
jgi:hypothetical protein